MKGAGNVTAHTRNVHAVTVLGVIILLVVASVTSEAAYLVAYAFRLAGIHVVAGGFGWAPLILAGLMLVPVLVLALMQRLGHVRRGAFYVLLATLLATQLATLLGLAKWSVAVRGHFDRYAIVVDKKPAGAASVLGDLGSLTYGSAIVNGRLHVFPIDRTRVIRTYEHLKARGYEVHYADPEFVRQIEYAYKLDTPADP